jgi:cytochrome c5
VRTIQLRLFAITVIWFMAATVKPSPSAQVPVVSTAAARASQDIRPVIDRYCVTCHNERVKTAGLMLDTLSLDDLSANGDAWEKVLRKVQVGMMPPAGMPKPDAAAHAAFITALEATLDRVPQRNPGRPLVHRLNRTEYANAVRDLIDLEINPSALLPSDTSAFGFDNNADALAVSPVLLERYVNAAATISALAVGDPESVANGQVFRVKNDTSQNVHLDGLPIGTIGGTLARTTLPLDGEYVLQVKFVKTLLGDMRGLEQRHDLEFSVDGARVFLCSFGSGEDFALSLKNMTAAADGVENRCQARVRITAGPHDIGAAFLDSPVEGARRLKPFVRTGNDADSQGPAHLERLTITGPFNPTGRGDTPSRRRIFTCRPSGTSQEESCARAILTPLVHRAYRGHDTAADQRSVFDFYRTGRSTGDFDKGVQVALQRILSSPKFIYRAERDPAGSTPGSVYRVNDLDLAARLSFLLWSTIPDDALLDVAAKGRLSQPAVLDREVRRMLADPRSKALASNFAGQWLYLRNIPATTPNIVQFPDFDNNLRQAVRVEAEMFFDSVVRENRNILDLMTANYTFVNERLARHYGIPGITGEHFRRVTLTDDARRGLLGKAGILLVTSNADRTSPVQRGKWVLENVLGAPPPNPPANVPPFKEDNRRGSGKVLTMRERMEEHRANPVCSSCHKLMDPIGLAMENFDAVGAWRTREAPSVDTARLTFQGELKFAPAIDASGELMDGTKVTGPTELRAALLRQPDVFVQTVTEKLLIYAIGRGLDPADMPTVRTIVGEAKATDYRFASLILGIVKSVPFQMRVASPSTGENRVALSLPLGAGLEHTGAK